MRQAGTSAPARGPERWDLDLALRAERLLLPALSQPGLYRLSLQDVPAPAPQRWLACRIAAVESSPEGLPGALRTRLLRTAEASGGSAVRVGLKGGGEGLAAVRRALEILRPGRPVAPWLWAFFAAAMALELGLLAWRRRAG